MNTTANPGPSSPPTDAPALDDFLTEIKKEQAAAEALDEGALISSRVANVRAQVLPLLTNKHTMREELVELTAQVKQLIERGEHEELADARAAMMAAHREFAALCKATKREINVILRDAKRNAEKLGLTKLAEFFRWLEAKFNSPDAEYRKFTPAPATAGAN